ncbi:MAG: ABC transporter permease [Chloroflexi bacterium]|nr:MAG: ABC transporter permease [Chloroflexota bacterium]
MKIFDIALKDVKHTFLSPFSLVMMFGAPLLITGLLYFAFGSLIAGGDSFNMPLTKVEVANLDSPSGGFAAGGMLVEFLQDESLADVIEINIAPDEASARKAVNEQRADAAVIIPPGFTSASISPDQSAEVMIYQDPTLTIGPGIVKDLVSHFMDGFSGAKIAGQVASDQLIAYGKQTDPDLVHDSAQQYATWLQSGGHDSENAAVPSLSIVSPARETQSDEQGQNLFGQTMAGMIIFFVFFIGANSAQSIIHEDEQGTLSRLFTTPTPQTAILGGKFISIIVSLCIQVILLLLASSLLFGIGWGQPVTIALVSAGLIVASAGFGLMLMSFIKNTRQTGPVMGGVMTLTGMLGGLFTTGIPNLPEAMDKVSLSMPHGWALQGWKIALTGAGPAQVFTPVLVLLGMGILFLFVSSVLFHKRFAS